MGQPEWTARASKGSWNRVGRCGWAALVVMLATAVGACGRTALDYPYPDPPVAGGGDGGHAGVGGGSSTGHTGGGGGKAGIGGAIGAAGAPGVGGAMAGVGGNIAHDILIPITGALYDLVIDADDRHVYVTNSAFNRVEDVSLASIALQTPIDVGSQPAGLDLTPDGETLYVANHGVPAISVVDLASRKELRRINVPSSPSKDVPLSLAIAANGRALFSTSVPTTSFGAGGRMMILDIATDTVTLKADFSAKGSTSDGTVLRPSRDRSIVAAVLGDISSGPVFLYRSSTNLFSPEHDLNTFATILAVNHDGSRVLVNGTDKSYVLDENLNVLGTILGAAIPGSERGAAFASSGPLAYRAAAGRVETVDTSRFMVTGAKSMPDTMTIGFGSSNVGRMAVTSDGTRAVVITDHGLSLVALP